MKKYISGFTIVELLIVVIVIGILTTIGAVAYRGVSDRARNSQTISAAEQWYKGLEMYKARNGSYPNAAGCLGSNYGYNEGNVATGTYQCRQDTASSGIVSNSTLNTALAKHVTGSPSPAMVTASNSATLWKRGVSYFNSNPARLDVTLDGPLTTCPALGKLAGAATTYTNGNVVCIYTLGPLNTY